MNRIVFGEVTGELMHLANAAAEMERALAYGLIPCGGRGTRMLAVTRGQPKELLPIAGVPVLEHVVRECAASGITDLMIVVAPWKQAIVDHFSRLEGDTGLPGRIVFAMQPQPRGLADAIRLGRDFAQRGSIAVALPDNVFLADQPGLSQVMRVARATEKSVVAMVGVTREDAAKQGATAIYEGEPVRDTHEFRIKSILEKRGGSATFDTGGAEYAYTGVGRYAFDGALWDAIDAVEGTLEPDSELDDVPVMRLMLEQNLLTGCLIRGQFLDVGSPAGYMRAMELLAH